MMGFLNLLEKEHLFLKYKIRRKDKVINILLDNFSNRVPEHSNYMHPKTPKLAPRLSIKLKLIYRHIQLVSIITS